MKFVKFRNISLSVLILLATWALAAAPSVESMALGEEVYETNCAQCHRSTGIGSPPSFPALANNANLADIEHVLETIVAGRGVMPSFSHLGAASVAQIASYIRNSWGNEFGPVAVAEAEEAVIVHNSDPSDETAASRTTWFTVSQAERGVNHVLQHCAACHGTDLRGGGQGAPPLAGEYFESAWGGQTMDALFAYTRSTMPMGDPGSLTRTAYLEIMAYVLQENGYEPGDEPLTQEDLPEITIAPH